jgi:hypothetical protein
VNCKFKNNKDSRVITLGTCILNVLCQLYEKSYMVRVFIVECDLYI